MARIRGRPHKGNARAAAIKTGNQAYWAHLTTKLVDKGQAMAKKAAHDHHVGVEGLRVSMPAR